MAEAAGDNTTHGVSYFAIPGRGEVVRLMLVLGGIPFREDFIDFAQWPARKAKARADKASQAQVNRARFGRTKAQRQIDAAEEQRRAALLEGAKITGQDEGED